MKTLNDNEKNKVTQLIDKLRIKTKNKELKWDRLLNLSDNGDNNPVLKTYINENTKNNSMIIVNNLSLIDSYYCLFNLGMIFIFSYQEYLSNEKVLYIATQSNINAKVKI